MRKLVLFLVISVFCQKALAWEYIDQASIAEMIVFENGIQRDVSIVKLTSDNGQTLNCFIPHDNEALMSLMLTIYATGKKVYAHCHDAPQNHGGIMAHKLHRVVTR